MNRTRSIVFGMALLCTFGAARAEEKIDAKYEVLKDVTFCMSFFNGMSLVVASNKKSDMESVRDAFAILAATLAESDKPLMNKALKETADRAASEIVGRSGEQRYEVSKRCAPYLAPGGVEKAVAERGGKQ